MKCAVVFRWAFYHINHIRAMNTSFRPRKFVFLSAIIACAPNDMRRSRYPDISPRNIYRQGSRVIPFRLGDTTEIINEKFRFGLFLVEYGRRSNPIREKFEKFELPRVILRKREGELFRSVLAETCFFLSFSDAVRMRRYENANRFSDLANFLSSLSFCASFLLDIARSPNWKSTRARACAFTPRDSTPSS